MTALSQAVVQGLGQGSVYALVALGFVIIYRASGVLSLAQPALMVVGATVVVFLHPAAGFVGAVASAMALTAALAAAVERTVLRPVLGRPPFVLVIITIGVDIVLRVLVNRVLGPDVRTVGDPWGLSTSTVAGVALQHRHLARIVVLGTAAAALGGLLRATRVGLALQATALDQETASAQGIDVGRMFGLSWAIAGALAALAGAFLGAGGSIDQATWLIALKALPAIVVGGLGSVPGAVVGGLTVGVAEALAGVYQPRLLPWLGDNFAVASPYVLLLLVLLVRPYGLFGRRAAERL